MECKWCSRSRKVLLVKMASFPENRGRFKPETSSDGKDATMTYSNWTRVVLASGLSEVDNELRHVMEPGLRQIVETVISFFRHEVSPTSSLQFEEGWEQILRELGKTISAWSYNHVESDDPQSLPHDVPWKENGYRRTQPQDAQPARGHAFRKGHPVAVRVSRLAA